MGMQVGDSNSLLSEINVTPFVDVMLVLLIIFMITAPMLTQGLDVDLPRTRAVENLPQGEDNIILSISNAGEIKLNDFSVEIAQLAEVIQTNVTNSGKQLYLKADKGVPYGAVVAVMGEARVGGVENLGIVAESTLEQNKVFATDDFWKKTNKE